MKLRPKVFFRAGFLILAGEQAVRLALGLSRYAHIAGALGTK